MLRQRSFSIPGRLHFIALRPFDVVVVSFSLLSFPCTLSRMGRSHSGLLLPVGLFARRRAAMILQTFRTHWSAEMLSEQDGSGYPGEAFNFNLEPGGAPAAPVRTPRTVSCNSHGACAGSRASHHQQSITAGFLASGRAPYPAS